LVHVHLTHNTNSEWLGMQPALTICGISD